jgi:hypothetical protein
MFDLLRLPQSALSLILRNWIESRDLGRVDSAVCCRAERPQFLNFLTSASFVLDKIVLTATSSRDKANQFLDWAIKREVKAKSWSFSHDLEPYQTAEFAQRTGGPHVRTLTLRGLKGETAGIFMSVFGVCKGISMVALKNTGHWGGLSALRGEAQQSLQELYIYCCGTSNAPQFNRNNFPSLQRLYLSGGYAASTVNSLLQAAPNLTDLRLKYTLVDDIGLQTLATRARNLKILTLWECDSVTDRVIALLASSCVSLSTFSIVGCRNVTIFGLEDFANSCNPLTRLKLMSTRTSALEAFAMRCGAALLYLSLEGTGGEGGLLLVGQLCDNLRELELRNCRSITAGCLVTMMSSLPNLRELVMEACPTVTDAVLIALSTQLPALKALSLFKASGYSSDGALALLRSLKALQWFAVETDHPVFNRAVLGMWKDKLPQLRVHWGRCGSSNCTKLHNWLYPSELSRG